MIPVEELAKVLSPSGAYCGEIIVLTAYMDESHDSGAKVFAVAGYIGSPAEWFELERHWAKRLSEDGIKCWHAADCESGFGEFKALSKPQRIALKTDLVSLTNSSNVVGFGTVMDLEDHRKALAKPAGKKKIGKPYHMCLQLTIITISRNVRNLPDIVAYVVDQQEEYSGYAKAVMDDFKKVNPLSAPKIGTLTYASKAAFVPLQVADNLAYECMKLLLNNLHDKERVERIAMTRMKKRLQTIKLLDERAFDLILSDSGS